MVVYWTAVAYWATTAQWTTVVYWTARASTSMTHEKHLPNREGEEEEEEENNQRKPFLELQLPSVPTRRYLLYSTIYCASCFNFI